ncbi:MAG: pyridoxamine 5-phosphate oxidase [Solirubrobacterales bacterium]|jgi:pyridoxamine 5'-phosphate oxidase|nr:pyridoxamine 5-phosphate oxidase [Solirubrobacterales bacterium]
MLAPRPLSCQPVSEPTRHTHPLLRRADLAEDPIEQFDRWYQLAAGEVPLPEAMTLATVDSDGAPDARMVLLKGHGPDGFRFFTNYESAKAGQIAADPRAALAIYWRELDRQVRVRGSLERLPAAESDAYFVTRLRESRLGAWASPQSQPLPGRDDLERRLAEVEAEWEGVEEIPRPGHWGGFLLRPETVEFWQGQRARLHDRFLYRREAAGGWRLERLAP